MNNALFPLHFPLQKGAWGCPQQQHIITELSFSPFGQLMSYLLL
jgi:hypothetical protein